MWQIGKLKNKNLSSLVRFAVENNRNGKLERNILFFPKGLFVFPAPPPPTPAALGGEHFLPEAATGLHHITPGRSLSQAALLMELGAIKAPATTGITLAPSPCQPRFFFFFFFKPENTPGVSSQHRGCP